jgi:protein phosphatase 2C family protein 2/3
MGRPLSQAPRTVVVEKVGSETFKCAVAGTQGKRESYEDAHGVSCIGDSANLWILDGHRGTDAAHFGASALPQEFEQYTKNGRLPSNLQIQRGFRTVDNQLRKYFKEESSDKKSGSTAVGVLVSKQDDEMYSAKLVNCGDSRGVIMEGLLPQRKGKHSSPGRILVESVDHKPNKPIELARIKAAGGTVSGDKCPRIDGRLSVSRGLGDFEFKNNRKLAVAEQKIVCLPDIYEMSGLQPGTIVMLACDGLWDVVSTKMAASVVEEKLRKKPDADVGSIAKAMVDLSLRQGSKDNVTVLIAQLGEYEVPEPEDIAETLDTDTRLENVEPPKVLLAVS